jgi:hypothetical protein
VTLSSRNPPIFGKIVSTVPHILFESVFETIEKIGEFCEFCEIEAIEMSKGTLRWIELEIGFPKGWLNFEVTEVFKFFHRATELVEPETSRMYKLLSAVGISNACAELGKTIEAIDAARKIEAKAANRLWERIKGTLKD